YREDVPALIDFYRDLDAYLPAAFQEDRDGTLQALARLHFQFARSEDAEAMDESAIRARAAVEPNEVVRDLLERAARLRAQAGDVTFDEGLWGFARKRPHFASGTYDPADGSIELIVGGDVGNLRFLPISTESGLVFVMRQP